MKRPNPVLVIALLVVIAFAVFLKFINPYEKYGRRAYWAGATVEDVKEIPDAALRRGNKNGPVLMWAATTTNNPAVIAALVARGADVNEPDIIFSGTPLSAAAGYGTSAEVVDELIRLGAKIDAVVGSDDKTPLIIAAEINPNAKIAASLIANGASTSYRDENGRNALEAARKAGANAEVVAVIEEKTK